MGYPGSQFAFLMRDSLLQQAQKLRAVTFKIGGYDGIAPETFQLHIYQYNGRLDAPPVDDILLENFNISPSASETGFLTYDVSAYNIIVPENGFFLAIEYFLGDIHGLEYPLVDYKPTGPILRPPCARADIRTWEYVIGKGWHRATNVENCWPLYESALSVEVEPAPKQPTGR